MTDAEVLECLARGKDGDEKAILELFHYMYPHVTKLVLANLPARESAEDLVQKVCVKVMSHLNQFSGKVPFLHWVSRIAVNTCLNQIRQGCEQGCENTCGGLLDTTCVAACIASSSLIETLSPGSICDNEPQNHPHCVAVASDAQTACIQGGGHSLEYCIIVGTLAYNACVAAGGPN